MPPCLSVARIDGSGRRSSSLDCLTSGQTQVLSIAVCNDLYPDRSLTHEPCGDRQCRQTQRRGRAQQKLRIPHPFNRSVALQIETVRKGQLGRNRHQKHRILIQKELPLAPRRSALNERSGYGVGGIRFDPRSRECHYCQSAWIAVALGRVRELRETISEPQPFVSFSRLVQRRRIVNFLHGPSRVGKPPPCIQNRRLDLSLDLPPCGPHAYYGMKWHGRPFQRRRHPPRISWIGSRHGRQTDAKILNGTCHGTHHVHYLTSDRGLRQRRVVERDSAEAGT